MYVFFEFQGRMGERGIQGIKGMDGSMVSHHYNNQ